MVNHLSIQDKKKLQGNPTNNRIKNLQHINILEANNGSKVNNYS